MRPRGPGAVQRLHATPLGILLIAALLMIVAAGLLIAGVYLILDREALTPWAAALVLVASPAILYLDFHLIRFARWTWTTLMVLIGLMLISSIWRLVVSPGVPVAPGGEILLELLTAWYLFRPRIRARFRASAE